MAQLSHAPTYGLAPCGQESGNTLETWPPRVRQAISREAGRQLRGLLYNFESTLLKTNMALLVPKGGLFKNVRKIT